MSHTFEEVRALVAAGDVVVTAHAQRELIADEISLASMMATTETGIVVEDYPAHLRGPCVLVRQTLEDGTFVHIVWGIRVGRDRPAAVITGYRPLPEKWTDSFTRRLT